MKVFPFVLSFVLLGCGTEYSADNGGTETKEKTPKGIQEINIDSLPNTQTAKAETTETSTTSSSAEKKKASEETEMVSVASKPANFSITTMQSTVNTTTLTLSWTEAENATSYDLKVSTNSDCSGGTSYTDLTDTSQQITKPEGHYYVCVNAKNDAGTVAASNNGVEFTIDVEFGLMGVDFWDGARPWQWTLQILEWKALKTKGLHWTFNNTDVYTFANVIIRDQGDVLYFFPKTETNSVYQEWSRKRSTYTSY